MGTSASAITGWRKDRRGLPETSTLFRIAVLVALEAFGPFDRAILTDPRDRARFMVLAATGIRPARGADTSDIQAWYGHTSPQMTRVYTGMPIERLRRMAASVDGRVGWREDDERAEPAE